MAPTAQAAAYCGPAHGLKWPIDDSIPADLVELSVRGKPTWYRLARHPRTGAPATDRVSRLLYVPASDFWRGRLTRNALSGGAARIDRPLTCHGGSSQQQ
jgi:hypothetical protein